MSIPASAAKPERGARRPPTTRVDPRERGKPEKRSRALDVHQVDPRERGETPSAQSVSVSQSGRSPRARGNLGRARPRAGSRGSIPASAGKPRPGSALELGWRVDPRERGETLAERNQTLRQWGRSPRARGNPGLDRRRHPHRGSIPASAGKPSSSTAAPTASPVDPRERGETGAHLLTRFVVEGRSPRARGNQIGRRVARRRRGSIPASAGKPTPRRPWRRR